MMTQALVGLDRIIENLRTPVRNYAEFLHEIAGENAKGLTLFGSIAAGSFDVKRHAVRNVLVFDKVDLSVLRRMAAHGIKLGKTHIAAPLIMTPDYIKSSLDTFPLEFIEIKQQHITLFGEDYFDSLEFNSAHIRLQCERDLKSILIGLRQGVLAATGREKFLDALQADASEGLMRTLRGMLWLKDQRDAKPAADVLVEIEKLAESKLPGLRAALNPDTPHNWSAFEQLYCDVEGLGKIVDAW
jgi:hypothetical protein